MSVPRETPRRPRPTLSADEFWRQLVAIVVDDRIRRAKMAAADDRAKRGGRAA